MNAFYRNILQPDLLMKVGEKNMRTIRNNVIPLKLFKYRPINEYTVQLIKESKLFHAHKDSFNDPFDGINKFRLAFAESDILDLVSFFSGQKTKEEQDAEINFFIGNPEKFEEIVRQIAFDEINQYGITCFSSKVDSTLLWAHYSDNHKGICIEFNFIEEVELLKNSIIGIAEFNLLHIRRVNYQNEIPTVHYKDISKEKFTPVYHKGKRWEYEDEYRSIRSNVGLFPFHKSCIKGIYFGLNSKEANVKMIKDVILNSNYSNMIFYQMVEQANSYDLGIEII